MSAFEWFLQIQDIPGEANEKDHKEWVQLLSISHQIKVPRDYESSRATARRQHGEFIITKNIDKATPLMLQAMIQNKASKMTIEALRSGGTNIKVKYWVINFEKAVFSDFQIKAPVNDDDLAVEQWSFRYTSIEWIYTQQKRTDGSGGGNVSASDQLTTATTT